MKAILRNYRQSPRKVRLVADLVRGKTVVRALAELDHLPKRAALPLKKLLASAVANAGPAVKTETLVVKSITVNQGRTAKRSRPAARGSAHPIRKRSSHVAVVLAVKS